LRYDDGKAAVDIPVLSHDELRDMFAVAETAKLRFIADTTELLREFFKGKKQELPKHLTSVPLQKQCFYAQNAFLMATVRVALRRGILRDGDFDNDDPHVRQAPPAMVLAVD
jgi:hypothetical protein